MTSNLKAFARAGAAVPCLALLLTGCGRDGLRTAPVRGTVTYQGHLVPYGTVMFQPENGPAATGDIQDGTYVLKTGQRDGAVPGKHKVTVISLKDQSDRLPEHRNPLPPPIVPLKYSFPDRSGLTAEVKDEANVINFDLK
jgi:hypothetical protein